MLRTEPPILAGHRSESILEAFLPFQRSMPKREPLEDDAISAEVWQSGRPQGLFELVLIRLEAGHLKLKAVQ